VVVVWAFWAVTGVAVVYASWDTRPPPRQHHGQTGLPTVVRLQDLYGGVGVAHPHLLLPRRTVDPVSLAAEKRAANRGEQGRRVGVVPIEAALPANTPAGPVIEQKLAGFPVMDLTRQVGLYGSDQSEEPPDTQLAAGPVNVAEADNSALSIWSKSGSLLVSADLNLFFHVPAGYTFGDPRILYDARSGRWFLTGFSFNAMNDSSESIAVSSTSDPTGSWNTYLLAAFTGVLGDQPMTGISDDKVVISWNDFTSTSFIGQQTFVLQKSDLLSGITVNYNYWNPDTVRFRIVPSQSLTSTSTEWLTYNNAHCPTSPTCNLGTPTIGVVAINGTPRAGNVTWTETDPGLAATTRPPVPRQPGGVVADALIDDRFLSAVWQNGSLWVSGNDGCLPAGDSTTRSCMRLIEISTAGTPTVAQDFDAASNGFDLYYPAVAVDSSGDLFIAFSESSLSLYPSARGVDSLAATPMTFENSITIASGQTSYSGTRWGDYSGAAQDPLDPADVWLTAEYQANSLNAADWGTVTARVAIQPSITSVTPNTGAMNVQQPVTIMGVHFQSGATVLFGANAASNVVVISSTQINATTPTAAIAGTVTVTINQPDGSNASLVSAYTYTPPPPPTVTSVTPNSGPVTGGTSVTITGTNFTAVTAVKFGVTAATTYAVNSATQITATSPAGYGIVDVTVSTGGGTSASTVADQFTYTRAGVSQSGATSPPGRSGVNQAPISPPGPRVADLTPSGPAATALATASGGVAQTPVTTKSPVLQLEYLVELIRSLF